MLADRQPTATEEDDRDRSADGEVGTDDPETAETTYLRSPRALGLLLLALALAAFAYGTIELLDRATDGLRVDLDQASSHLPDAVGALVDGAAIAIAAVTLLASIGRASWARQWRLVAALVGAPLLAGGLVASVGPQLDGAWAPSTSGDIAIDALLAAGAAAFTLIQIGDHAHRHHALGWAFIATTLAGGAWVTESLPGRGITLAAGIAAGAVVALAVGTPARRATAVDVTSALARRGFVVDHVRPQGGDARGSVPWVAELASGTSLFVKTYGNEERIADLLFRLGRSLRLRESGDTAPHSTLQHAVEHEAFAASRASASGARVPRVLALGTLGNGGLYAVHEMVEGRSLDRLVADEGPDALTAPILREAWAMVQALHRSGVAHRDLRAANVVIDGEDRVWLVDFAFADVLADEPLQNRDLAELLASTAALVGPERALDAAVTTLGPLRWEAALPMVQPLAVSTATRQAVGRRDFAELRGALALRLGAPDPELPRLARVDRRTVLTLAALTAAVWALLPQIGKSGDLWDQLPQANRFDLALAAIASLLTYVGATVAMKGAVAEDLPTLRTAEAQVASSFTNRVTPAKVGGMALNGRWLVKEGLTSPAAAAALSVNAIAGLLAHIALTVVTIVWAGKVGLGDLELPSTRSLLLGVLLIVATVGATYAIPPLRELVRHRVFPRARQSMDAVREVGRRPGRLAMVFGGSAFVSCCYIAALALSLRAVGASVPLSTVALVYLAGSALASAAPTPGGLGATEAVFAAALVTTGASREMAVPAVLLYRFVTFWLPILPGWIAFNALQRSGRL